MQDYSKDHDLSSYHIDLPDELIAQHPTGVREQSRLMVLDRKSGKSSIIKFCDIGRFLPQDALLVANNTKVLPARMMGAKEKSGGKVEFLLLTPLPLVEVREGAGGGRSAQVEGLLRSSKGMREGEEVLFPGGMQGKVLRREAYGRCQILLFWQGDLAALFETHGSMPLPPYIRRPDGMEDRERYQTVYSDTAKTGSVAAPTAGLHFTSGLIDQLRSQGLGWAEVSLYVGYGTFSPVRTKDVRHHDMHAEFFEISEAAALEINEAKQSGRPVVAVGTTTVRTLEGAARGHDGITAGTGWTDIYIYPGYEFQVVDHMVTNFHLPGSSLILMVSAFAERKTVLAAYRKAIQNKMRFFSYGDSMLIL